jgi:thioredoxin-like negative regulator of GroEL
MVMFGTDWCGNCDVLKPYFNKVANQQQNRQIPFVYVNPDTSPNSRELVDLTNIPMVVAFKKGKVIANEYGNKEEIVDEVLSTLLG